MGLGLYQGDKLNGAAQNAYVRELNRVLLPGIAAWLAGQLHRANSNFDFRQEALQLYRMLSDPERLDRARLRRWMSLEWRILFPAEADKQKRLQAHLDALLKSGFAAVALDEPLVQDVPLKLEADSPRQ
jgi:type VI secretion system protein ImpL